MAGILTTQNQAWASDSSAFGHKMLLKMGWTQGKGLGLKENGATTHLAVRKKADNAGIGAEVISKFAWRAPQRVSSGFNDVLQRLKPIGSDITVPSASVASSCCSQDHDQDDPQQQDLQAVPDVGGDIETRNSKHKYSKSKKSDQFKHEREGEGDKGKKFRPTASMQKKSTVGYFQRRKHGKNVSAYTKQHLDEIFGVATAQHQQLQLQPIPTYDQLVAVQPQIQTPPLQDTLPSRSSSPSASSKDKQKKKHASKSFHQKTEKQIKKKPKKEKKSKSSKK